MNYTELPAPRSGHSAVIYKTFNQTECRNFTYYWCYDGKPRNQFANCTRHCELDDDTIKERY